MSEEKKIICEACGSRINAQNFDPARPAGFWIRGFSELIDLVIILILVRMSSFTAPVGINYILGSDVSSNVYIKNGIIALSMFAIVFVVIFYEIWMHVRFGQTLGKMATSIKVITIDDGPVTYKLSFLRCVGKFVNILTFGLGFLMAAVHKQKRGLHDYIANTKVHYIRK